MVVEFQELKISEIRKTFGWNFANKDSFVGSSKRKVSEL